MKVTVPQLGSLMGRHDVYALQTTSGYVPVWEELTGQVLRDHLEGTHTVGTYTVIPPDITRVLVFDVDSGTDAETDVESILQAAGEVGLPARHAIVEFSGKKGYHVWFRFPSPQLAGEAQRVGRGIAALAEVKCEVFPKQPRVDTGQLGNLVKLPGGIHRGSGRRSTITNWAPPVPLAIWKRVVGEFPEVEVQGRGDGERRGEYHCVREIQHGVDEGGRNNAMFQLATMMYRMGLEEDAVYIVLQQTNETFTPPLEERELQTIVRSASRSGPICGQLGDDLHCGEACILNRTAGLKTRGNQVKYAANGERVVVEVAERDGGAVIMTHPDIAGAVVGRLKD